MKDRRLYRWLTVGMLGAFLFVLSACGPSATRTNCVQTKAGANYTVTVKNNSTDEDYTVRLQVSKSKLELSRSGDEKVLGPGESKDFNFTVKEGETRYAGVVWPAPGGDDTYKYKEKLGGKC